MVILGLLTPLVIQAEPFGETEITVFDTDFLPAPPGPDPLVPAEPPVPDWVAVALPESPADRTPPAILVPEYS